MLIPRNQEIVSEAELPDYKKEPPKLDPLPDRGMGWKGMDQTEYDTAEYDPAVGNSSGLEPFGPNILVKMDTCARETAGGIIHLDAHTERMDEAAVTGCVFAIGLDAFQHMADKPKVGERIYIDKYSGIKCRGKDGALYRVVDEKCVACRIADDLVVAEL